MNWRKHIQTKGIGKIAKTLGCSYEIVRLWVNNNSVPGRSNSNKLIALFREELSDSAYEEFKSSLVNDLLLSDKEQCA